MSLSTAPPRGLPLPVALPLALLLVLGNVLLDYYSAPTGILTTPAVLPGAVWLVVFARALPPVGKATLAAALISMHDCGIKLYGGGMHDAEGKGVIHAMLFLGLLPAFLVLVAAIDQHQASSHAAKRIAKFLFVGLIILHLALTANLGMGRCGNCY